MASNAETGNAKNVANFQQLITFVNGYGAPYNPARKDISITSLDALLQQAHQAIQNTTIAKGAFDIAVNQRREGFTHLRKWVPQVINALAASGIPDLSLQDAKDILRKMKGIRAKAIQQPTTTTTEAPAGETPADKHISVSQLSYDNVIAHFSKLVNLTTMQPNYSPNEAELTSRGLMQKLQDITAHNTAVMSAYTNWSNARLNRSQVLYNSTTGLTAIAAAVKLYVKSVYGASSPQYKQISGIRFVTFK